MNNEKLTIVVSTYNQIGYISDCLKSIIDAVSQLNVEIIIADDCSTDGTEEVCFEFKKKYPELIFLLNKNVNLGGNKNYLRGHLAASGEYVAHVDGDDIVDEVKFKEQLNLFKKNKHVNLIIHSSKYFSDTEDLTHVTGSLSGKDSYTFFTRENFAAWGTISVHSSYMYRKSSINLNNFEVPFMEWSVAMALLQDGCGIFINKPLIRYRYNPGGTAWTASQKGRASAYEIQFSDIKKIFNKNKDLRVYLYSQVIANSIAIIKGGNKFPDKMPTWLLLNIKYFAPLVAIGSILIRNKMRPRLRVVKDIILKNN